MTLARLIEAVEAGTFTRTDFSFGGWHPEVSYDDARRAFLGSLDAAKRLHDALLPGWVWGVTSRDDQLGIPAAFAFNPDNPDEGYEAHCEVPARALLLADLKALAARAMEGRDG